MRFVNQLALFNGICAHIKIHQLRFGFRSSKNHEKLNVKIPNQAKQLKPAASISFSSYLYSAIRTASRFVYSDKMWLNLDGFRFANNEYTKYGNYTRRAEQHRRVARARTRTERVVLAECTNCVYRVYRRVYAAHSPHKYDVNFGIEFI